MTTMTYADLLRPAMKGRALVYHIGLVIFGSLLVALSARIVLPLPFSPVPITGQTLTVLLVGASLGSRLGGLSLLLYLMAGLARLPVFAGGMGGPLVLLGPTGGYLIGFVAAAYLAGLLAEKGWDRRFGSTVAAMLLGNLVIYAFGLLWLARYAGDMTLRLGLYPYLPGDLLKVFLAALLLPFGWWFLNRRRPSGV
ncbi:biotin transporter BioY [Chloroflexota bacterium]